MTALGANANNPEASVQGEIDVKDIKDVKDDDKDEILGEAADLLFHYLVLLQAKGYSLKDVTE